MMHVRISFEQQYLLFWCCHGILRYLSVATSTAVVTHILSVTQLLLPQYLLFDTNNTHAVVLILKHEHNIIVLLLVTQTAAVRKYEVHHTFGIRGAAT